MREEDKIGIDKMQEIIKNRLDTIYEHLKEFGNAEPYQAFKEAPEILKRQVKEVIDEYWQWDSDFK